MLEILNRLTASFNSVSDEYDVFVASEEERQQCFEVRKIVFGDELKRGNGNKASPAQKDDLDDDSIILGGRDKQTQKVVATMRITPAIAMAKIPSLCEKYKLTQFPRSLLKHVAVITRLCLLDRYRQTPLSLLLATKGYEYCLRNDYVITTIVCEPNLYPLYRNLGFRPLGRIFNSAFGGYRLPLFLMIHDYTHLKRIHSLFYRIAKQYKFPEDNRGLEWFRHEAPALMRVNPGFAAISPEDSEFYEPPLFHNISKEGKASLLKNAIDIHCNAGDYIISRDAGERTLGFITQGIIEIVIDGKVISILGRGDIFGEISFILEIPRTANVIAAVPNTHVILLSLSCFKRLTQQEDKINIWKNLSKILAIRLAKMAADKR